MFLSRMLAVPYLLLRPCAVLALLAAPLVRSAQAQSFMNVSGVQGLAPAAQSTWGSSVSFHDFDHDGWDDLSFAVNQDSVRIYRNVEGTLQRLPSPVATFGQTKHLLWVDVDNDGDDDLFLTTYEGSCRLLRNNGAAGFSDITNAAGLPLWNAPHFAASFADYDRDGFLDLYICTYVFGVTESYPLLNHLYRNNGDGTFTDVTLAAGVGNGIRFSFQGVWMDYDLDGWPDLFVINDRTPENTLYRNNGDGTFTDVTASSGVGFPGEEPMSATIGDFDHDGDLDIFMSNSGNTNNPPRPCILLVNNGDGTFSDRAAELGLQCNYYGWGATWLDMGNDRRMDLIVASNFSSPTQVHRSNEAGLFQNPGGVLQGAENHQGWCVSSGDLNNDGHADVAVSLDGGATPELWVQQPTNNHWIKITPQGTVSNRNAIGTWVRVHAQGRIFSRYTTCGANLMGQDSQHLLFGLGDFDAVDSVVVVYPSGHQDVYHGLAVDEHHQLEEGETYQVMLHANGPVQICAGDSVLLDAGEHPGYIWNTGHTGRYLQVYGSGAYHVQVLGPYGITAYSDTVLVVVNPLPEVLVEVLPISCAESADGQIALNDASGLPATEVIWSTGYSGDLLSGVGPGEYGYVYTDANGCSASGNVLMVPPPELVCLAESTAEMLGNDGTIMLFIFGGTPPYNVLLDGIPAGTTMNDLVAGTYLVTVLDKKGCSVEVEVVVSDATGIRQLALSPLHLAPNPARNEVHLLVARAPQSVELFSMHGTMVRSWQHPVPTVLDLSGLASSTYQLLLRFEDGSAARASLVKQP
ncbi:MAG: CRTAC1 family protein [Flavobacteriales bacterium]|nr:CRTAC1 family protein [Flavobacteriales bacterium]